MRSHIRASSVTRGVVLLLIGVIAEPTVPSALAGRQSTASAAERGRAGVIAKTRYPTPLTFNHAEVPDMSAARTSPRLAAEQAADSWDLVLPAAPAGSRLLLTMAGGAELECRLVEVRPDAVVANDCRLRKGQFATETAMREAMTFARGDVTRVAMVSPPTTYASTGRPDAAVVRFLVTSWGVGKKVDFQTTAAERVRARIVSIDPDGFRVAVGTTARQVAYADVQRLRQDRMGTGKKIGIAAAVYGVIMLLVNGVPWRNN